MYFRKPIHTLSLGMLALSLQGCGERIDARQAVMNNGLIYKMNASEPFTGQLEKYTLPWEETVKPATTPEGLEQFTNCIASIKNGVRDGGLTCASPSGVKVVELMMKDGARIGIEKRWNADSGKLIMEREWQSARKLLTEVDYDPTNGKKNFEATWINYGSTRGVPDGQESYFDATGKLVNYVIYRDGFVKETMSSKLASTAAAAVPSSAPAATGAEAAIKVVGKTADGKYPIYELEGELNDTGYFSSGVKWTANDLQSRLAYIAPEDVDHGYSCDWVCKDSANHIVGLNPGRKPK